jgi:hypothetical protein
MKMAKYTDYDIAVWDGESKKTTHKIKLMKGCVFVWKSKHIEN